MANAKYSSTVAPCQSFLLTLGAVRSPQIYAFMPLQTLEDLSDRDEGHGCLRSASDAFERFADE